MGLSEGVHTFGRYTYAILSDSQSNSEEKTKTVLWLTFPVLAQRLITCGFADKPVDCKCGWFEVWVEMHKGSQGRTHYPRCRRPSGTGSLWRKKGEG